MDEIDRSSSFMHYAAVPLIHISRVCTTGGGNEAFRLAFLYIVLCENPWRQSSFISSNSYSVIKKIYGSCVERFSIYTHWISTTLHCLSICIRHGIYHWYLLCNMLMECYRKCNSTYSVPVISYTGNRMDFYTLHVLEG